MTTDNYQPISTEAEQVILAALLTGNRFTSELMESITEDDFHDRAHKLLYRAVTAVWGRAATIDAVQVINALGANLEASGGLGYLADLAGSMRSGVNPMSCVKVLKEKRLERQVIDIAERMKAEILAGEDDSLTRINNAMSIPLRFNIEDTAEKDVSAMLMEAQDDLEARHLSGGKITGLETGFSDLDKRLQGLQAGQLIILAARPAMGKTTLALNLFEHSALHGDRSLASIFFSLEMPGKELCEKMICSVGDINHGLLKQGLPRGNPNADSEWPKVIPAFEKIKAASNLVIDERSALSVQQIRAKCLKVKKRFGGLKSVFIDYLTYIKTTGRENRVIEVGAVSRALKALAKELECPVICLAQLSRKCEERGDKRPLLSDLRDSGEIEQDADCIMFIYRDDYYNEQSDAKGLAEIIIAKNRSGETGKVHLVADLTHSRFRNMAYDYEQYIREEQQRKPQQSKPESGRYYDR